jgi:hypothetical protein
MSHNKHIADYVNQVHELLRTTETKNINSAIGNLTWNYSGPGNRFIRQAICSHLTGENTPLVKSGVSHLADYTKAYVKRITKEGVEGVDYPNTAKVDTKATKVDTSPQVGMAVVRKACKRKGSVTAVNGDKVEVTLEDGSVRKPNVERFTKLYAQL